MSDEAEMHGREAKALCGANSIRYHPLLETAAYEVTGERRLFCLYCLHSAPYTLSFILPSLTLCVFSYTAATLYSLTIYCFLLFLVYLSVHSRPASLHPSSRGRLPLHTPRHSLRFAYTLSLGTAVSVLDRWSHVACIPDPLRFIINYSLPHSQHLRTRNQLRPQHHTPRIRARASRTKTFIPPQRAPLHPGFVSVTTLLALSHDAYTHDDDDAQGRGHDLRRLHIGCRVWLAELGRRGIRLG